MGQPKKSLKQPAHEDGLKANAKYLACVILSDSWNPSRDQDQGEIIRTDAHGNAVIRFSDGNHMSFSPDEYEIID